MKLKYTILLLSSLLACEAFSQCKIHRVTNFENTKTKVWQTTIFPNAKLSFHTHQNARVVIPETDGQLTVIKQRGARQTHQLIKNQPLFLSVKQGLSPHQDLNPGKSPIRVTVIELKGWR